MNKISLLLILSLLPVSSYAQGLTIDECVTRALQGDPGLSAARAESESRNGLYAAAKKDIYPSLSARYGYTYQPDSLATPGIDNYYAYSVILEQPLYHGKALVTAVDMNHLAQVTADHQLSRTRNDLILEVHTAFYNLLKAGELENEAALSLKRLESHLKDAKAFHEVGLIPKNDLLLSELELAQGEQNLLLARSRTSLARSTLNLLMRQPVDFALEIQGSLDYQPYRASWQETVERLKTNRPELAEADTSARMAELKVILEKAPYLPSLDLNASYTRQGDDPAASDYPPGSEEVKQAQIIASWNFWSWGQQKDKTASAMLQAEKARSGKEKLLDHLVLQARDAFLNIQLAEENIRVTRKAIEQAEENFRINTARYQAQLGTSTELLDSETLLTRARTNNFNALFDFQIALVRLKWSEGTIGRKED
ncbi:MAG: TolC family protein [Proteobacteria bacterium]|nr:TolC family protein [Pseudomonadota bacterium]MBU1739048.1 TolC family protein [Pseudomonadota bacterium]